MQHYGLPDKDIRIMKAFLTHTVSAVRVNGEVTGWFVNSGTGIDLRPSVFRHCVLYTSL